MQLYPHSPSALEGGGWSTPGSGRFTPREGDSSPLVQADGWSSGAGLYRCGKSGRLRSPTHSKSLYRLRYTGRTLNITAGPSNGNIV